MRNQILSYCATIALIFISFFSQVSFATNQAILMTINSAIGPATQDYVKHGLEEARKQNASLVILRLDTPGGLKTAMRGINKDILASTIPVVTYVAPAGARAASAGTFILYASHLAAMAPGTNIGAASPISIGGAPMPTKNTEKTVKANQQNLSTEERKAKNDATAYIHSLAELRGRNVAWAESAVQNATSLSAQEALKMKVINVIANDIPDLLKQINGRTVTVNNTAHSLETSNLMIKEFKPGWRIQFLTVLTDPNIAYVLLLMGIYGLFFEFYNPGLILPGVIGAISLLIALYAFQMLPINYVGFALLLLGIAFMTVEVFISSFGILGIGGVIAFVTGSILLLDINTPGYHIAWSLILTMSIVSAIFFLIVVGVSVRAMRKKVVSGCEALIGCQGQVLQYRNNKGLVKIQGERWKVYSVTHLEKGQKVRVKDLSGLVLIVEPVNED